MDHIDFEVKKLGEASYPSPFLNSILANGIDYDFITDSNRVIMDTSLKNFKRYMDNDQMPLSFEKSGPHEKLYFNPVKTSAAIVTCGGLCPGLNNVIRSLVNQLHYRYNVTRTLGFQYGFEGFIPKYNHPVIDLTPQLVEDIHLTGGSILGSSRGNQDVKEIVNTLVNQKSSDGKYHGYFDQKQSFELFK